jgi:hypothetical protein
MAKFDWDNSDYDAPTDFEIIPEGTEVRMKCTEAEDKETSTGGEMVSCTFQIVEGEHKGRKIFDQLNLVNPNPTTVEIAQRTLSAICHATGKMHVSDSEELHLIPMMIQVKIKPPKNGYGESNAIAYLPPERGAVARAAKPTPAGPATSEAPPKMASAPWNKKG